MGDLVLAVDPGKATGWATYDLINDSITYGEVEGRFAFYDFVHELAISTGADMEIVCESWDVREDTNKFSRQSDPYLIWGYLEGFAYHKGFKFKDQPPAFKSFGNDPVLAAIGWKVVTPEGHARDAMRHLLKYLVTDYRHPEQPGGRLLEAIATSKGI